MRIQVALLFPKLISKDKDAAGGAPSVRDRKSAASPVALRARMKHGSWDEAFGYRFDAPDRSIVTRNTPRQQTRSSKCATAGQMGEPIVDGKMLDAPRADIRVPWFSAHDLDVYQTEILSISRWQVSIIAMALLPAGRCLPRSRHRSRSG